MFHRTTEDCIGCGACVDICPLASTALIEEDGKYSIVPEECCDCGNCINVCEAHAIEYWEEESGEISSDDEYYNELDEDSNEYDDEQNIRIL